MDDTDQLIDPTPQEGLGIEFFFRIWTNSKGVYRLKLIDLQLLSKCSIRMQFNSRNKIFDPFIQTQSYPSGPVQSPGARECSERWFWLLPGSLRYSLISCLFAEWLAPFWSLFSLCSFSRLSRLFAARLEYWIKLRNWARSNTPKKQSFTALRVLSFSTC